MGYLDKIHKKIQMEKMIEQAMNSPKYKEAKRRNKNRLHFKRICRSALLLLIS